MKFNVDWKFCSECENVIYFKGGKWDKCAHSWRPNDPFGVMGNQIIELSLLPDEAKELYKVRCYQSPLEMDALLNILSREKIETIVEIGSCHGGTANIWRTKWPQADIVCIDVTFDLWLPDICVSKLTGDTTDPRTLKLLQDYLAGKPVDFLFIDGDHSYFCCKNDWDLYSPLVRPGGIIGFHDIMTLKPVDDVFHEIPAKKKLRLESFQGIGVAFK